MTSEPPVPQYDLSQLQKLRQMGLTKPCEAMERHFTETVTAMARRQRIPVAGAEAPDPREPRSIRISADKGEVELRGLSFEIARNLSSALNRSVPGSTNLAKDEASAQRAFTVTFVAEREPSLRRLITAMTRELEHRSAGGIPIVR
jgi:hypothetical protein